MKNLCQCFQFQIGDIAFVRLDSGNHIFIHIVACQLELAGKITLGETVLASQRNQAFTDQVFFASVCPWFGHGMSFPAKSRPMLCLTFCTVFLLFYMERLSCRVVKVIQAIWPNRKPCREFYPYRLEKTASFRFSAASRQKPYNLDSDKNPHENVQKQEMKGCDAYHYRNRSWLLCH